MKDGKMYDTFCRGGRPEKERGPLLLHPRGLLAVRGRFINKILGYLVRNSSELGVLWVTGSATITPA